MFFQREKYKVERREEKKRKKKGNWDEERESSIGLLLTFWHTGGI